MVHWHCVAATEKEALDEEDAEEGDVSASCHKTRAAFCNSNVRGETAPLVDPSLISQLPSDAKDG